MTLSLPLPDLLPARAWRHSVHPEWRGPAPASLILSFCSGGEGGQDCVAGCGRGKRGLDARIISPLLPAGPTRPAGATRRRARNLRVALADGVLPARGALARAWRGLGERMPASVGESLRPVAGRASLRRRSRLPATPESGTPDRFALAMQQWPVSVAALGDWQAALVEILHFCDALPGLTRSWHSSLRSRVTSAESRLLLYGSAARGQPFVSFRVSSSSRSWR